MFIQTALSLIAPHRCLSCGRQGSLVCSQCYRGLALPKVESCVVCNRLSGDWRLCPGCRHGTGLRRVVVASRYEGMVKELILNLKYRGIRAAAMPLAALLSEQLSRPPSCLSFVPASLQRQRRRGYHPAGLIAHELGRLGGVPVHNLLGRLNDTQQVGAARSHRLEQLKDTFYAVRPAAVLNKRILVIDDVATTGATLIETARALKVAGATSVEALVVAKE